MHKNSPFPLALVSKSIVIIAVVVLILCISDVQKKNSKKKRKKATMCVLLAFKHSSVRCLLVFVAFNTHD